MSRTPILGRTIASVLTLCPLAMLGLSACSSDGSVEAKVVRVIDGDTFEAEYGGNKHSVRLLNVNTPETKHPNKMVGCQGPEATRFLEQKLPPGSAVTLRFDKEPIDKYGRVLAAAFRGDEFVNASIARAGLGVAESYGDNTKYFDQVKAAQDEASKAKVGLFQVSLSCSPSAVAQDQITSLSAVAEPPANSSSAAIASAATLLAASVTGATAAKGLFEEAKTSVVVLARGAGEAAEATEKVTRSIASAQSRQKTLSERATAVKADEDRKAAEARAAEEKRRADEAAAKAAAEAARQYIPPAPTYTPPARTYVAPAPAPAPAQQNSYPGYTGPRCYAPGGKTWTPCPGK